MFAISSGFDFLRLTIALYLNCPDKMDKIQTGGRFNAKKNKVRLLITLPYYFIHEQVKPR